jgi:hypothetical protein
VVFVAAAQQPAGTMRVTCDGALPIHSSAATSFFGAALVPVSTSVIRPSSSTNANELTRLQGAVGIR